MASQIIKKNKAPLPSAYSAGFTLVELLISITLGMLLVAAASQLFVGGVLSARLQQAGADMQDNGLFGLDFMSKHTRLANYGNVLRLTLDDTTAWGGVVLTATNLPVSPALSPGLLSHSDGDTTGSGNEWTGASNVAQKSDQLTIQFQAPTAMSNCEGVAVLPGDLVVERFFLRQDTAGATTDIALACDANTPSTGVGVAQPAAVTGLGDAGQILMNRVDQFHVLLGVQNPAGNMNYYTIKDYKTAAAAARTAKAAAPHIVSIAIAALVRSNDNTNSTLVDLTKTFPLLEQTVKPNTVSNPNTNRYVRQVYSTTVALRNGMGSAS